MKRIIMCVCLLASAIVLYAQTSTKQGLQPGDTLPNIIFGETLLNNPPGKSFNDLKGKLIILDLWGIGCSSCVQAMPHLDSLQEEFKDNVQIMMVSNDRRANVERYLKKIMKSLPTTPMMTGDSILNRLFPHLSVPHHVWIDQRGVIRYITSYENATAENIEKFFRGEHLAFSHKKELLGFNDEANLYAEGNGRWDKAIKYHTLYATALDGVEFTFPQVVTDTSSDTQILRVVNYPIKTLFQIAYNNSFGDGTFSKNNRVEVQSDSTIDFMTRPYVDSLADTWKAKRASYEAVIPGRDQRELYAAMRRDLNIYSPFIASVEKRKVECLILVDKRANPTVVNSMEVSTRDKKSKYRNKGFSVYQYLKDSNVDIKTPIIDETKTDRNQDPEMSVSMDGIEKPTRMEEVRKELQKHGLDLVKDLRDIDILVIKDKK
ncbi:TlpA family protein disulfide reductase [Pinibacter aurantiacus]|uniref:TlpA family protein disulfide reductase n=1 Tax=Pinibacter aurantiacus TaxID=2851599 RepID=A0A9E2S9W1_9BACT|nr:TlpA disulfide reductase family protein [Pinibacter aurantiacus]MBV4357329.1 TlpA family protein disulfide reductase [Pinibacter aurantiacus]